LTLGSDRELFFVCGLHTARQELGFAVVTYFVASPLLRVLLVECEHEPEPENPACLFCLPSPFRSAESRRTRRVGKEKKSWVYVGEKTPKRTQSLVEKQKQNQKPESVKFSRESQRRQDRENPETACV
jgi:hypothetical protein